MQKKNNNAGTPDRFTVTCPICLWFRFIAWPGSINTPFSTVASSQIRNRLPGPSRPPDSRPPDEYGTRLGHLTVLRSPVPSASGPDLSHGPARHVSLFFLTRSAFLLLRRALVCSASFHAMRPHISLQKYHAKKKQQCWDT